MNEKSKIPTPEERPDLYDHYDYPDRSDGYLHGCRIPERLQKLIDEKGTQKSDTKKAEQMTLCLH